MVCMYLHMDDSGNSEFVPVCARWGGYHDAWLYCIFVSSSLAPIAYPWIHENTLHKIELQSHEEVVTIIITEDAIGAEVYERKLPP